MARSKVEGTPTLLSSPRSTPPTTAGSATADQQLHQNRGTVPMHCSPKTRLLQAQRGGGGGRNGSSAAVPSYGSLQTCESADDSFVSFCVNGGKGGGGLGTRYES